MLKIFLYWHAKLRFLLSIRFCIKRIQYLLFLSYVPEALTFIACGLNFHLSKNCVLYYNHYRKSFCTFQLLLYLCTNISVKPYQFKPWKSVQGMLKKTEGLSEKLLMRLNILDRIWKPFFEFSRFMEEANTRERCNLDEQVRSLSRSGRAKSVAVFSARIS